jgi:hypothetical protein
MEDVVARMVVAVAEVNSDASLRDVVDVQVQLGCQRSSLPLGVLDEADGAERKESFGRVRVEQRLHSMKGDIGSGSRVLGR